MTENNSSMPLFLKRISRYAIAAAVFVAAYGVLFYCLDIGCVFLRITGIPCPGCGMTRAAMALMEYNFASAFYYHPAIYILIPVVPFCIFAPKPYFGSKKRQNIFIVVTACIVFGIYLYRLLTPSPIYLFV